MSSLPPAPILQPGPPPAQSTSQAGGGDRDDRKDKGKRLGQACGACRKRKVYSILNLV